MPHTKKTSVLQQLAQLNTDQLLAVSTPYTIDPTKNSFTRMFNGAPLTNRQAFHERLLRHLGVEDAIWNFVK